MDNKINRGDFLRRVKARTGYSYDAVVDVYDGIMSELIQAMMDDKRVSLTGFGTFYVQTHKGHPVQFAGAPEKVSDYKVMKFSASNIVNKKIRKDDLAKD